MGIEAGVVRVVSAVEFVTADGNLNTISRAKDDDTFQEQSLHSEPAV